MKLQYYMHDGPQAFRFELAGVLDNDAARRLDQDWRTASSAIGDRRLIVDLTFVTDVEDAGRALLERWQAEGAQLIAKSEASRKLIEMILGKPLAETAVKSPAGPARTWQPFYASLGNIGLHLILLFAVLAFPASSNAANLKAETVAAWDQYVQAVSGTLQDRVRPGGQFLWTDEDAERIARIQRGETVVAPAPGPSPRKVAGGLIHHWIGAAFLPGARLDDILDVMRDYDRYKEFYQPSVIESNTVARGFFDDRFSMLLMDRAFFLKTAVDADYQVTNVRLDDRRFYSVSRTTRVQEIEDYGQPSQHRLPEGQGGGYIWKLLSIARLEQRDGGVHVEMETVALSRDIPGLVRPVVDPIVRRVSINSIRTSIRETEDAVCGNSSAVAKSAGSGTASMNRASAFIANK